MIPTPIEFEGVISVTTKGEALINGIEQIQDGLEMIAKLGDKESLIITLVGSQSAARRLRDVIKSKNLIYNLVISLVKARNTRLVDETVKKVIDDFMDVLFDLSTPYKTVEEHPVDQMEPRNSVFS